MLRLIEFTHEDHRYRAQVDNGYWLVSINGGGWHRGFEAQPSDRDTPQFQQRVVNAAHMATEWERRTSGEKREGGERDEGHDADEVA
jgi:hypothetical protein